MTRMTEGNFYFTKRLHSTDRCYVAVRLFSSRSQMITQCSKTWVSHWAAPCVPFFLFLLRVDVINHLLLDRSTATWNLFVSQTWILIGFYFWHKGDSSIRQNQNSCCRFHVALRLCSNRSQITPERGKNKKVVTFLPRFDAICDILLNCHTVTLILLVSYDKKAKCC